MKGSSFVSLRKQPSFFALGPSCVSRNATRAKSEEGWLFSQASRSSSFQLLHVAISESPLLSFKLLLSVFLRPPFFDASFAPSFAPSFHPFFDPSFTSSFISFLRAFFCSFLRFFLRPFLSSFFRCFFCPSYSPSSPPSFASSVTPSFLPSLLSVRKSLVMLRSEVDFQPLLVIRQLVLL